MRDTEVLFEREEEKEKPNFATGFTNVSRPLIVFAESHPGSISIISLSARDVDRTESVSLFRSGGFIRGFVATDESPALVPESSMRDNGAEKSKFSDNLIKFQFPVLEMWKNISRANLR